MSKVKIQIVEDETIVAYDLKNTLQSMGYEVSAITVSGEKAIKAATKFLPDIVFMDIVLEGKIDGVTTAAKLKERLGLSVIFLTAYSDNETLQRAKKIEPFGYVLKPFTRNEIKIAVEVALHKAKMEKKLKNSEERYKKLYENSNDALIIYNEKGMIIDINKRTCEMLGYPRRQLIKMPVSALHSEEELPVSRKAFQKIKEKGNIRFESRFIKKDGTLINVDISSSIIDKEKRIIQGIIRDITARKKTEEERKKLLKDIKGHVKELDILYQIVKMAVPKVMSAEDIIRETVALMPQAWQYPEITCVKIVIDLGEFVTDNFKETGWKQSADIIEGGANIGSIEVFYLKKKPLSDEGPFLKEERHLINTIARLLGIITENKKIDRIEKWHMENLEKKVIAVKKTRDIRHKKKE